MQSMRRFFSTSSTTRDIQNLTVIGSGLMGSGIAQVAAQSKLKVIMVDQNERALQKGTKNINHSLKRIAKKKFEGDATAQKAYIEEVLSRISVSTNSNEAVSDSDLVIEAIVESLAAKHSLFKQLDEAAPQKTIFASNTSSLPIAAIASVTKRLDRFAGLHYFNPVPQMKLVEIIKTNETSESVFQSLYELTKTMGKTPVVCKDTPGFIVNRLLVPYMLEALRLVERGDATKEDVDVAMKLGAGYRKFPFRNDNCFFFFHNLIY